MIVIAANFVARRIEARRRTAGAVAAAAAAAEAGEDADAQEAAYQQALTDDVYAVPRLFIFLFVAVPWLLCFFFLPIGRYIDILHSTLKSVIEEKVSLGLRRNAALVTGSTQFVIRTLPSQLHLFRATSGGLDVFAVLSPSGDEAVDALALEWMLAEPDVVAVRILTTKDSQLVGQTAAADFVRNFDFPSDTESPSDVQIDAVISELVAWRALARLIADEVRRAGHKYHNIVSLSTAAFVDTPVTDASLPDGINLEQVFGGDTQTREKPPVSVHTTWLRGTGMGVGAVGHDSSLNSNLSFYGPREGNTIGSYNAILFFGPAGLVYRILERALPNLEGMLRSGVRFQMGALLRALVESAARELGSTAAHPLTLLRYELPIALLPIARSP